MRSIRFFDSHELSGREICSQLQQQHQQQSHCYYNYYCYNFFFFLIFMFLYVSIDQYHDAVQPHSSSLRRDCFCLSLFVNLLPLEWVTVVSRGVPGPSFVIKTLSTPCISIISLHSVLLLKSFLPLIFKFYKFFSFPVDLLLFLFYVEQLNELVYHLFFSY